MNYQIGTFFVKETENGYQICYMTDWSSNPQKVGQPVGLIEIVGVTYLKLSIKKYRDILKEFGAEYKVLTRMANSEYKNFEHGEMFFDNKQQAEKAMDWANSILTELHLLGKQYNMLEDLKLNLKTVQPTLIPKSQIHQFKVKNSELKSDD